MFRCERRFFLDGCTLSGLRGLRPPVAPYEVASRHFFDVASTPPHEEGTTPASHNSFGLYRTRSAVRHLRCRAATSTVRTQSLYASYRFAVSSGRALSVLPSQRRQR